MTPSRAQAAVVRAPQTFLSFDYGRKRTGVASGNRVFGQATPLTTVTAEGDARFERIARLIAEWQPDALVVGVPRHPDGAPHENTRLAQRFARQLHGRFRLPVFEVDERYSTTEVLAAGARDADAAAAALLLEQYFNESDRAALAAKEQT
ncbi:Holliday junction resolvase YqgF [Leptothrix cholodnii SP-6]|uniref:Putative pre-16S rRNA nuclease n=1 Tax=Leptothrix cholodnii (strain ATCC 51168 / LMG 8142 / SP-6) TaxID=395495 RepID=B1Y8E9_LEPCP|nr:Holliday junction resolvase RuvX [Leptothrix cholodnii]ACB36215.1 Holliday junction resolvase YqgF [Leptothrix cholodnii SP-6]